MIRLSSSFFISLAIHTFLALVLFYSYKNIIASDNKNDEKIELKLCCIYEKTEKTKPEEKENQEKPKQENIPQKTITLPKEKTKTKPIEKPKPKTIDDSKEEVYSEEPIKQNENKEPQKKAGPPQQTTDSKIASEENKPEKESTPQEDYLNEHIKQISKLLRENLYYPRSARKRGITGEVIVRFRLLKNGTVRYIEIIDAKSEILSDAAIKTIENLSGEFPKPKEELILNIPINYSLTRG